MKNKVNKKTLIFIIITSVLSLGFFGLLLNYQYKTYTINYNNKINSLINEVINKYPEVNESDLVGILNSESEDDLLNKYGINDKSSSVIENDKLFKKYLFIDLSILFIIIITMCILLLISLKELRKLIK